MIKTSSPTLWHSSRSGTAAINLPPCTRCKTYLVKATCCPIFPRRISMCIESVGRLWGHWEFGTSNHSNKRLERPTREKCSSSDHFTIYLPACKETLAYHGPGRTFTSCMQH